MTVETENRRCTIRCKMSQQKDCECSCGGKNHGTEAVISQMDMFADLKIISPALKNPPIAQARKKKRRVCVHCSRLVYWKDGYGITHDDGTRTIMECPHCHWQGFAPAEPLTFDKDICPQCGVQGDLIDNHVAMPGRLVDV